MNNQTCTCDQMASAREAIAAKNAKIIQLQAEIKEMKDRFRDAEIIIRGEREEKDEALEQLDQANDKVLQLLSINAKITSQNILEAAS